MSSQAPNTYEGVHGSSINHHFWNVKSVDVDKSSTHLCDRILGSQKLHSIFGFSSTNPIMLLVRFLSCFYALVLIKNGIIAS
jgi:hypothetical protein